MPINRGKKFEECFKQCWEKTVPNSFLYRLQDQVTGYKYTSANICDFIAYKFPYLYLLECKSHAGKSFPLCALTQYERLKEQINIKGVKCFVILWLMDCEIVCAVPISSIVQMYEENKKSISIKDITEHKYDIIILPSEIKRVYPITDYSILVQSCEKGD